MTVVAARRADDSPGPRGIVESRDESEGEFVLDRIRSYLLEHRKESVRQIADGLLAATDAYIPRGSEHLDDRMVIVLRRIG